MAIMGTPVNKDYGMADIAAIALHVAEIEDARAHNWFIDLEHGVKLTDLPVRERGARNARMIELLANWALAKDMITRLEKMPEEQRAAELAKSPKERNFEELQSQVNRRDGSIWGEEESRPELFQEVLNSQLESVIKGWRSWVAIAGSIMDEGDEMEVTRLFDQRDRLEYTAIAIEIIQLEYPRMKDVDLKSLRKALAELDESLKIALKGRTIPEPYADKTFWWRQK